MNTRRYVFKLYPTGAQAAALHAQRPLMADLWNACKQRIEDTYRREGRMLSYFDLTKEITGLRHECQEWQEIPAVTAHRIAKCLVDAYKAFFRRLKAGDPDAGYPRWRRRDQEATIPLGTMATTGWRIEQCEDNPLSWRLHYGSVTDVRRLETWIHARGKMPTGATHSGRSATASLRRQRVADALMPERWRNADIIWRDGGWWLSLCVALPGRRTAAAAGDALIIRFNLVDCLAYVDGIPETPPDLLRLAAVAEDLDRMKSARDQRWPRGRRRSEEEQAAYLEATQEIALLSAYIARRRRNALHVWTARLVARANALTIIKPPSVRKATKTGRGDAQQWGANVRPIAELNRAILAAAPAAAIAMLEYKAAEAGIRCEVTDDLAPAIHVGAELSAAGKTLRRARRETRRAA